MKPRLHAAREYLIPKAWRFMDSADAKVSWRLGVVGCSGVIIESWAAGIRAEVTEAGERSLTASTSTPRASSPQRLSC